MPGSATIVAPSGAAASAAPIDEWSARPVSETVIVAVSVAAPDAPAAFMPAPRLRCSLVPMMATPMDRARFTGRAIEISAPAGPQHERDRSLRRSSWVWDGMPRTGGHDDRGNTDWLNPRDSGGLARRGPARRAAPGRRRLVADPDRRWLVAVGFRS